MKELTSILEQIEQGDPSDAEKLLPLVYEELRKLAAHRLQQEQPGQTLQATALVHEAYLRLVGSDADKQQNWDSRGHFFAAAAEAMRRIVIENARRKGSLKAGRDFSRIELSAVSQNPDENRIDLLALDEALTELEQLHPEKAQVVKLRYFAGLSLEETAAAVQLSRATAQRHWAYARAWLFGRLQE